MSTVEALAEPSLPPLLQGLQSPLAYPHPVAEVSVVETHISWVVLAGAFAYKIKKPLRLPFLDYSSLPQREAFCRAEVELNQRFGSGLYIDAVAIGGPDGRPVIGGTPVIEWAVRLHRFDESQRLDHLCKRKQLDAAPLVEFAGFMAACQANAARAPVASTWGAPEEVLAAARENFTELRGLLAPGDQTLVVALEQWTELEYARRHDEFARRQVGGCIREGHGDLHLGNLVMLDGRIRPFDCIEFNESFRWIDVANDIAFLWMDLLDHQRADLAGRMLNAWLEHSGDFAALGVFRFYAVYRAIVRAKIAALRGPQGHGDALEYLQLASRIAALTAHAVPSASTPARPPLVITHGLSGSGKTRHSGEWLSADPDARCIRLRSDVERKRLFGLAPQQASQSPLQAGIYTTEATVQTYDRLYTLSVTLLDAGYNVIVDAAFLRHHERQRFSELARTRHIGFGILHCQASLAELEARVKQRRHDASEATVEVLHRQLDWLEPLSADELACVVEFQPVQ